VKFTHADLSRSWKASCQKTGLILDKALVVFAFGLIPFSATSQTLAPAMRLTKTIVLPGVQGKLDHFAIDLAGNRLFLAATGSGSVQVIDLKTDKVRESIGGLVKPHGLAWDASTGTLYVTDGALAELRAYKGEPFSVAGTIKLSVDADDMMYDNANHMLFVGHGGSDTANAARVAVIDTDHFALIANVGVASHPEGLDFDRETGRLFVNVADSNEVAVIDTAAKALSSQWKVTKAAENVPMAFDREHHLVFVACRTPGTLIALDSLTGREIASLPAAGKADDLFYDPALRRVYLISGAGEVDLFQVDEGRTVRSLSVLQTVPGAKTALFVPSQNLVYLGVPGTAGHAVEVREYSTAEVEAKK
jgi:YVTN family beta-propeller protein